MKNLARGSVFFALAALIGFLFYFQPTVVAEGTFSIANDSPRNIQLEQVQQNTQIKQQLNNQTTESTLVNLTYNNFNLSETKAFRATAYCLKGRTATGGSVRRGIVAADRRVLPLGTTIQISAGAYSGTYTVADTGGAVKGNVLDIWVPSCAEANRFGRRTVMVSVVGK
ncbi:MAG: 3D domain-containing protein [Pyrinomonadaceae bacterium]